MKTNSIAERIVRRLNFLWAKHVTRDPVARGIGTWYGVTPTGLMLYEHRLPPKPVIFDVGGFTGVATAEVVKRYPDATVHVFEPLPQYVQALHKRFGRNRNVKVHAYGVAGESGSATIHTLGEASSTFRQGGEAVEIELRGVKETFAALGKGGVDLMMINAEGAEYELLEMMASSGLSKKVGTLVVQFHPVVKGYRGRHAEIAKELGRTHDLVFRVPYVWEKWVRR